MDIKCYPPRIRLEVVQTDELFFVCRKHIQFSLIGGEIKFCRIISIPVVEDTVAIIGKCTGMR